MARARARALFAVCAVLLSALPHSDRVLALLCRHSCLQAGQEKYHSLAPMYYRGAAAAIVVYDITQASSFV